MEIATIAICEDLKSIRKIELKDKFRDQHGGTES